ncbi:MAG: preprotein translocase subunit SecE [Clostridia bacterium]
MSNIEKKTEKKKEKKAKRTIGQFFKEVFGEVKKLSWPTKKELVTYTLTVLGFIVLMAIIIYALDLAFGQGLGLLSKINLSGTVASGTDAVASGTDVIASAGF